ncbi:putative prefoldin subunit 5 [Neolecta irregularis DAH-3]|uniref:Putative prefoldin subunit 5 n=1 Tax=Neolecta irregularis (strain DAH-3) TaxID=1198029 RepID=A0A1U7LH05_NEOID|nr:putative prefoldin subunit 5 [Neolecta irregularis DAH-3]|eukprot:OLL21908.1 putative prefoldin subunit 5 [Neolecta irregularis DAH-3]
MATSPKPVDLTSLNSEELKDVKRQLDLEIEQLTQSYTTLRTARNRFIECQNAVEITSKKENEGKEILVPLTVSLYVPGKIKNTEMVNVDLGTGYHVDMTAAKAMEFYKGKVEYVEKSLSEIERILDSKAQNGGIVTQVLREKIAQASAQSA